MISCAIMVDGAIFTTLMFKKNAYLWYILNIALILQIHKVINKCLDYNKKTDYAYIILYSSGTMLDLLHIAVLSIILQKKCLECLLFKIF